MLARCFFFNDTATTEIYTLSLHDALPISSAALTTTLASGSLTIGLLRCVTLFDSWPVSIRYSSYGLRSSHSESEANPSARRHSPREIKREEIFSGPPVVGDL